MSENNNPDPNSPETEDQLKYRFSASRYQLQSPSLFVNQDTIVPQAPGKYPYPRGDASNIPTTNIDTNHATNAD